MLQRYLKNYRIRNNLTQKEMAERLRTSQGYYCLLETGRKKPGFTMINRISKLLSLEPSVVRNLL